MFWNLESVLLRNFPCRVSKIRCGIHRKSFFGHSMLYTCTMCMNYISKQSFFCRNAVFHSLSIIFLSFIWCILNQFVDLISKYLILPEVHSFISFECNWKHSILLTTLGCHKSFCVWVGIVSILAFLHGVPMQSDFTLNADAKLNKIISITK